MTNDWLVTKQSTHEGFKCNTIYIVETVNIAKEIYVAILHD